MEMNSQLGASLGGNELDEGNSLSINMGNKQNKNLFDDILKQAENNAKSEEDDINEDELEDEDSEEDCVIKQEDMIVSYYSNLLNFIFSVQPWKRSEKLVEVQR